MMTNKVVKPNGDRKAHSSEESSKFEKTILHSKPLRNGGIIMEHEFSQWQSEQTPPADPIQPPMEDVIKPARKQFSKLGLMFFLGTLLIILVQTIASAVAIKVNAGIANSTSAMLLVTMLPMYAIAMPLMGLLISRIPSQTIAKKKMTFVQWLIAFLICYGGMYASNLIGLFLTEIIAVFKGAPVTNTIAEIAASSNVLVNFFIMVICAPIAEELLFRKLLIERTVKYGEGTAVLFSGLMFALFHGNLNQFVYAFTLGIFFGFIFVKTGNILYTIYLHMLINFLGSIPGVLLLNWLGEDFINALSDPALMTPYVQQHLGGIMLYALYGLFVFALAIAGIIFFCVSLKKLRLFPGEVSIPKGKRFSTTILNVGMAIYFIYWIIMIVIQLLS